LTSQPKKLRLHIYGDFDRAHIRRVSQHCLSINGGLGGR
jgi:hypothetical protein